MEKEDDEGELNYNATLKQTDIVRKSTQTSGMFNRTFYRKSVRSSVGNIDGFDAHVSQDYNIFATHPKFMFIETNETLLGYYVSKETAENLRLSAVNVFFSYFLLLALFVAFVLHILDFHGTFGANSWVSILATVLLIINGITTAVSLLHIVVKEVWSHGEIKTRFLLDLLTCIAFCYTFPKELDALVGIAFLFTSAVKYFLDAALERHILWFLTLSFETIWFIWMLVGLLAGAFPRLKSQKMSIGHLKVDSASVLLTCCILEICKNLQLFSIGSWADTLIMRDYYVNIPATEELCDEYIPKSKKRKKTSVFVQPPIILKRAKAKIAPVRERRKTNIRSFASDLKNDDIYRMLGEPEVIELLNTLDPWHCDPSAVNIDTQNPLGSGAFGTVFSCDFRGGNYAVKILNKPMSVNNARLFIDECNKMIAFQHPNLVQMQGCHFSPFLFFVITELASKGTLEDCILSDTMNLTLNNRLLNIMIGVIRGINYLHTRENPIIHRDIKPENVLVRENFTSLLSDFGDAKKLSAGGFSMSTLVGTPIFIAPEISREEASTTKSDIYSFGFVLFVISTFYHNRLRLTKEYCRLKGHDAINPNPVRLTPAQICIKHGKKKAQPLLRVMKAFEAGERPLIPDPFKRTWPDLADLIKRCWQNDPSKRPKANEIIHDLEHTLRNASGKEDDYLGVDTFPLRLALYKRLIRTYKAEKRNDAQNSWTTYVKYPNLWFKEGETVVEVQAAHKVYNCKNIFMSAGMSRELPEGFTVKHMFRNCPYERTPSKQMISKAIDPWIFVEKLELQFPFPIFNRVIETVSMYLYQDGGENSEFLYMLLPRDEFEGEYDQYFDSIQGWKEPRYAVRASAMQLNLISYPAGKRPTQFQFKGFNPNGSIPTQILYPFMKTKGLEVMFSMKGQLGKTLLKSLKNVEHGKPDNTDRFKPENVPKHHTEYLLPFWPLTTVMDFVFFNEEELKMDQKESEDHLEHAFSMMTASLHPSKNKPPENSPVSRSRPRRVVSSTPVLNTFSRSKIQEVEASRIGSHLPNIHS
eukprot:g3442.t1